MPISQDILSKHMKPGLLEDGYVYQGVNKSLSVIRGGQHPLSYAIMPDMEYLDAPETEDELLTLLRSL